MKIRSPILIKFGAVVFAAAMWLLFRTLKLDIREDAEDTNPYSPSTRDRFLYCVWHDSMIVPTFGGKHRRTAALTSQHTDGSFVAQVLRVVGMSTIRGSTNRIRPSAIRALIKTAEDNHIVITPDGPRGPRREMSVGIAYLASRTGRGVVPTAYSCTRCWRIRGSWTDLLIPKPFSKVFLLAAKPIEVPAELDSTHLQEHVALIQAEMDRLNLVAEGLANGAKPGKSDG
ncbi:MAG: lysophospholipid acyltransferase family protein [Pirellulales bacterium]